MPLAAPLSDRTYEIVSASAQALSAADRHSRWPTMRFKIGRDDRMSSWSNGRRPCDWPFIRGRRPSRSIRRERVCDRTFPWDRFDLQVEIVLSGDADQHKQGVSARK
jgi:hypothetical protein